MSEWTFFSNHAHVLFVLSQNEDITVRDLAGQIGITERFVHKILSDLQEENFITVEKVGRNNRYRLNPNKRLRHSVEQHIKIGELIELISD